MDRTCMAWVLLGTVATMSRTIPYWRRVAFTDESTLIPLHGAIAPNEARY
jgi:hypothetical protein